jgi:hypothetical protein
MDHVAKSEVGAAFKIVGVLDQGFDESLLFVVIEALHSNLQLVLLQADQHEDRIDLLQGERRL